jgi:hypothetical protein
VFSRLVAYDQLVGRLENFVLKSLPYFLEMYCPLGLLLISKYHGIMRKHQM